MSSRQGNSRTVLAVRLLAGMMVVSVALFLVDNYLIHWRGWPGLRGFLQHLGAAPATARPLSADAVTLGWAQLAGFLLVLAAVMVWLKKRALRPLREDADLYSGIVAYLIRAAFWAVFLIGLTDMLISFLRVENLLPGMIGKEMTTQLGRPVFRGTYVHYPLIGLSLLIAAFTRSVGFIWLTFLVVLAELQIVIFRFVFSYEQAYMGDLVRFWYAALFLFASAYTLLHEGHVRVDVLYAGFSRKGKAAANACGSVLLGLPFCWTILIQGMSNKGASINSPLRGFEISQSGFGMYVKYLMAGFLLIFAVSMALQFVSLFLYSIAELKDEAQPAEPTAAVP